MLLGTPPEASRIFPGHELGRQIESFWHQLQPLSTLPDEWVRAISMLARADIPEPLVLWVSSVDPLAAGVGDRIRCATTHTRGSLGFPTDGTGSGNVDGFLTVGHVIPGGVGCPVQLESPSRFGRSTYSNLGSVVQHADPVGASGTGGWDYAVVALDPGVNGPPPLTPTVASLPAALPQPTPVTMHGGVSGIQTGGIVGALTTLGVSSPPAPPGTSRLWRDCWIMIPSAMAQQGDSGAAVIETSTGAALGMLIGGSRQLPGTTYAVQYVQDLENLTVNELAPSSVSVI